MAIRTVLFFQSPSLRDLARPLESPDLLVISAPDSARAAHALATARPDLLICDPTMPGVDLKDLLSNRPRFSRRPRVLLACAEAAVPYAVHCVQNDLADDILPLPAPPSHLHQKVSRLLGNNGLFLDELDGLLDDDQTIAVQGALLADRYLLQSVIGEGATGVVWRARDQLLDLEVAVKILRADISADGQTAEEAKAEARIAMQLAQSNIVRLYNLVQTHHVTALVMEYIEGTDLEGMLREYGRFNPEFVLGVVASCAAALDYAHRHNILHRDLKPANLILTKSDTLKIIDFGVAGLLNQVDSVAEIAGTPWYMSPEQLVAGHLTPRSDQFSIGILTYQMLTGIVPVEGEFDPEHPEAYRRPPLAGLPEPVLDVLRRATAEKPEDRFPDVSSFSRALRAAILPDNPGV